MNNRSFAKTGSGHTLQQKWRKNERKERVLRLVPFPFHAGRATMRIKLSDVWNVGLGESGLPPQLWPYTMPGEAFAEAAPTAGSWLAGQTVRKQFGDSAAGGGDGQRPHVAGQCVNWPISGRSVHDCPACTAPAMLAQVRLPMSGTNSVHAGSSAHAIGAPRGKGGPSSPFP